MGSCRLSVGWPMRMPSHGDAESISEFVSNLNSSSWTGSKRRTIRPGKLRGRGSSRSGTARPREILGASACKCRQRARPRAAPTCSGSQAVDKLLERRRHRRAWL
jgi:hypothetical protein